MSPMKPARPCRYQGCARTTTNPSGYCEEHLKQARKQYDNDRGTPSERGYGAQWQKQRAFYLAEHPLCEDCEAQGIVVVASMVHHLDGNQFNNDPDNYRALCNPCHMRQENSGFNPKSKNK